MSKSTKKNTEPAVVTIETPVGLRNLPEGHDWWRGNGRGHTRDFIAADGEQECRSCHDDLPLTSFPTLTVPRKDGRTRGTECRACRKVRKEKAAKAAARAAARKAKATAKAA